MTIDKLEIQGWIAKARGLVNDLENLIADVETGGPVSHPLQNVNPPVPQVPLPAPTPEPTEVTEETTTTEVLGHDVETTPSLPTETSTPVPSDSVTGGSSNA